MDHIKNVAIVGAGGNIGSVIAKVLLETGNLNVTAITRPNSTSVISQDLHIVKTEYDHGALVNALKGQDVLIITMSVTAPPDSSLKLIDAAIEAGVNYVMPNEWGVDPITMPQVAKDMFMYDSMMSVRNHLDKTGAQWIGVASSFWYQFSLAGSEARYGFDFGKKTATFYDDGETKINTTTWPQIGRAIASILREPEKYRNKSVSVNSFYVSQKDMLESVQRVTGESWTVQSEPVHERYERGVAMMQGGDMTGFGIAMYARGFYPDGALSFETENTGLALPEEDLDMATKEAVEMARGGQAFGYSH